jgi:hypothetical protein
MGDEERLKRVHDAMNEDKFAWKTRRFLLEANEDRVAKEAPKLVSSWWEYIIKPEVLKFSANAHISGGVGGGKKKSASQLAEKREREEIREETDESDPDEPSMPKRDVEEIREETDESDPDEPGEKEKGKEPESEGETELVFEDEPPKRKRGRPRKEGSVPRVKKGTGRHAIRDKFGRFAKHEFHNTMSNLGATDPNIIYPVSLKAARNPAEEAEYRSEYRGDPFEKAEIEEIGREDMYKLEDKPKGKVKVIPGSRKYRPTPPPKSADVLLSTYGQRDPGDIPLKPAPMPPPKPIFNRGPAPPIPPKPQKPVPPPKPIKKELPPPPRIVVRPPESELYKPKGKDSKQKLDVVELKRIRQENARRTNETRRRKKAEEAERKHIERMKKKE